MFPRSKRLVSIATGISGAAAVSAGSAGSAASLGIGAAGVGAGASLIGAGAGLLSTSMHASYGRNFEMRVANLLKLPLQNAAYSTWGGYISSPPHSIRPCELGALAGHKTGGSATGTSGIVDWKIKEKDLTIILFWSVPYDGHNCNSLGLAIYKGLNDNEPSYENRYEYFYDMYYYHENFPSSAHNAPKTINTVWHCSHAREFCTNNAGIYICGTMSTGSDGKFDVRVGEVADPLYCAGEETDVRKPSSRTG